MNLQSLIRPELWQAIEKSYASGSYKHAILDAFHYMTDVIREKADVDGDGVRIAGSAFGGSNPKIRINNLQTQSEKDAQTGLLKLIEGLYTGIRNPRSHEQIIDTIDTTNSVILFINYILGIIDTSKGPFVMDEWIDRVFDPDFYASDKYVALIMKDVPRKRYVDVFIQLYRDKMRDKIGALRYIFNYLVEDMKDSEIESIADVISAELRYESNNDVLLLVFRSVPPELWPKVEESARLRIENKLLKYVSNGNIPAGTSQKENVLGAYLAKIFDYMIRKGELASVLLRISGERVESTAYVIEYYLRHLPHIIGVTKGAGGYTEEDTIKRFAFNIYRHEGRHSRKLYDSGTLISLNRQLPSLPVEWRRIFDMVSRGQIIDDEEIPF